MIPAQSRKVSKVVVVSTVTSGLRQARLQPTLPMSLYSKATRATSSPCHPIVKSFWFVLFIGLLLYGDVSAQSINLIPPRLPNVLPEAVATDQPRRDQPLHILAIRVEFVRDTLTTTTGDGSFDYGVNDTMHFDPPPHDSLYFADNLEFLQFYWGEMSDGAVDLSWDIYPAGAQAAYQLPKQIWQYNYNHTDEQLDHGLAELFRDAVQSADKDSSIVWQNYNRVIVFHAGAGAEFDVGFSITPHDLPSAWIVKEDFSSQLGLDVGILVVDNGDSSYVESGIILPETESHDEIQISMLGVMCSLFGHSLGLPGLYDADDGQAVVGKWSLMDRGFGNFYGAIPSELDAWSRSYMGWVNAQNLDEGTWAINARGFEPDGIGTIPVINGVGKIQISPTEYFLIENRNRDPEGDSIAVAYDRDGRRMTFKDDYTVEAEDGFRVPVRIDNLDFDSPGSGILIWHVDRSLYSALDVNKFNSQNNRRGLDIEEADGAQDIGQDYAFLTPGYGTDYGVFEDAWYKDNEAHRKANSYRVRFNDDSSPNSKANSGASTHITIDDFSLRSSPIDNNIVSNPTPGSTRQTQEPSTTMTFSWSKSYVQEGFPVEIAYQYHEQYAVGNFDDDPYDEIIVFDRNSNILFFNGDGTLIHTLRDSTYYTSYVNGLDCPAAVADINNDGKDDIITFLHSRINWWQIVALISNDTSYEFRAVDDIHLYTSPWDYQSSIVIGGPPNDRKIFVPTMAFGHLAYSILDKNLSLVGDWATDRENYYYEVFTVGSAESDTFLVIDRDSVWVFHDSDSLFAFGSNIIEASISFVADFDASGEADLAVMYNTNNENARIEIYSDFISNHMRVKETIALPYSFSGDFIPVDLDRDGQYEINGIEFETYDDSEHLVYGLETSGVFVNDMDVPIGRHYVQWEEFQLPTTMPYFSTYLSAQRLIADLDGDGLPEFIQIYDAAFSLDYERYVDSWGSDYLLDCVDLSGKQLSGFPIAIKRPMEWNCTLTQLDDDTNLEFIYISNNSLNVIEIPATNPTIWWGSQYRDKQNRNAIWELARPHSVTTSDPLMPDNLCYNWPNPARESTAIRYFLNFNATVKVDIFDITGQRVTTLYGEGTAGQHHEILWNTRSVARGGYLAVVEAKGAGKTESKIVKIAVVK